MLRTVLLVLVACLSHRQSYLFVVRHRCQLIHMVLNRMLPQVLPLLLIAPLFMGMLLTRSPLVAGILVLRRVFLVPAVPMCQAHTFIK